MRKKRQSRCAIVCQREDGRHGRRVLSEKLCRTVYEAVARDGCFDFLPKGRTRQGILLTAEIIDWIVSRSRPRWSPNSFIESDGMEPIVADLDMVDYRWVPLTGKQTGQPCPRRDTVHSCPLFWYETEWADMVGFGVGDLLAFSNGNYYRVSGDDFLFFHGD